MSEERNIEHQHGRDYYHEPPPAPLLDTAELKRWSFYRATIAEFIGTLLFLFLAVSTVVNYKEPNYTDKCSRIGYLGIALAHGGVIFVLVHCTSGISGGHLNPAVTFGMLLPRRMSLIRAAAYMVAQCLGAVLGALFVIFFMDSDEQQSSEGVVNVVTRNYTKGAGLVAYSLPSIYHKIITFLATVLVLQATETSIKKKKKEIASYATLFPESMGRNKQVKFRLSHVLVRNSHAICITPRNFENYIRHMLSSEMHLMESKEALSIASVKNRSKQLLEGLKIEEQYVNTSFMLLRPIIQLDVRELVSQVSGDLQNPLYKHAVLGRKKNR